MFIALASYSADKDINRPLLDEIAHALEFQLMAHYAPMWQSDGVQVRAFTDPINLGDSSEACPLIIFDDADQSDALGYHSVDPYGRSFGKAFWSVLRGAGGTLKDGALSLSVTLSHEVLEMVGNPYVNFWADTPDGDQEAIELCDRVQGDSYRVGGVSVSDFLGPRAFRQGPGPYNWLQTLKSPFEIRPNGYAIRRRGDDIRAVFGESVPEWRRGLVYQRTSRMMKRVSMLEQTRKDST